MEVSGMALPGVILGNAIELAPLGVIDVDPQDRAEPITRILTGRHRIVGGAAVAQREIKEPVRPEGDRPAVVVLVRIFGRYPDALFAGGVGATGFRSGRQEPGDDRVPPTLVV